ncbi:MAG: NUDIX domain-containing protein [Acidobacteria bacterium]|nr:NUDIX domain-containing protein [Acidobacteriota bacterium]
MVQKNSHCSYCGAAFDEKQEWPRPCASCGQHAYLNPLPVAVLLLPIDEGLLLIRRRIEPEVGKLALPGGYINVGETWQAAAARELWEETGITIAPEIIEDFRVLSASDGTILIFGVAQKMTAASLPEWLPSPEVSECVVINSPQESAFPLHTQVIAEYFNRPAGVSSPDLLTIDAHRPRTPVGE